MSNISSTPPDIEAINNLLQRTDTLERAPNAITRGAIILWYRPIAELPSGWWPCDGTAAPDGVTTPDFRGRAPFGLKSTDTAFDALGETGGAASANLQHGHSGAPHDHTIAHTHSSVALSITGTTGASTTAGGAVASGIGSSADPAGHVHAVGTLDVTGSTDAASVSTSGAAAYTGNSGNALSTTQSVLNPYCVVLFVYRWV